MNVKMKVMCAGIMPLRRDAGDTNKVTHEHIHLTGTDLDAAKLVQSAPGQRTTTPQANATAPTFTAELFVANKKHLGFFKHGDEYTVSIVRSGKAKEAEPKKPAALRTINQAAAIPAKSASAKRSNARLK